MAPKRGKKKKAQAVIVPAVASTSVPWSIEFFQRHFSDDPTQVVPARNFLDSCPENVRAKIVAVAKAVAAAPPPRFGGGGWWEAMHGDMHGYYEIRADTRNTHYRVFCFLESDGPKTGLAGPTLVLIAGLEKTVRTVFTAKEYAWVRALGDEYKKRRPRSVASRAPARGP